MSYRAWPVTGNWSDYFDRRRGCKRSDRPHEAHGFCKNCYARLRFHGSPAYYLHPHTGRTN